MSNDQAYHRKIKSEISDLKSKVSGCKDLIMEYERKGDHASVRSLQNEIERSENRISNLESNFR